MSEQPKSDPDDDILLAIRNGIVRKDAAAEAVLRGACVAVLKNLREQGFDIIRVRTTA